ncbi:hypothetical protein BOX15_Mlig000261g4 [Macrostomum lignano]|uniref:Uncharacterized protein n=1 Tax=Macrostomum lignano TaxID=282301 RepID=A0A267FJS4_9PLAT|nr:hypothetical protein BOX15_Mlig000261g4 [Macrostomum lignano]
MWSETIKAAFLLLAAVTVLVFQGSASAEVAALTLRMSAGPQTDIQPGGRVDISCAFDPPATYIFWRFSSNNGVTWNKLALCHADSGKCSLQEQFKNWTDRLATRVNGSLTLWNASKEQDGVYECEGIRNTDAAKDNRSITIVTPPAQPTVTAADSDTATEGSRLNLTCQSVGGNPPPQISWSVRQRSQTEYSALDSMSPVFSWQPPAQKFGSTVASVSVLTASSANLAGIVCHTAHPLANATSNELLIKVLYAPKLPRVASQRAIAGSSVGINCTADANPVAKLTLLKSNSTLSEASQPTLLHSVPSVTRNLTGAYSCLASNSIGSARRDFSLTVLYPPAVQAPSSVMVREGASLQVGCNVEAEPPPFTVNWRHPGSGRLLGNSSQLLITAAARTDAGEWTCEAQNLMSPSDGREPRNGRGSATVQVTVQYPPGMPVVAFTAGTSVVQSGSRVALVCRPSLLSPGVPEPGFSWTIRTSTSTRVATGPALTIESTGLEDSGEYACVAENSAGRGPAASVSLTVQQPPRWLDDSTATTTTTTTSVGVGSFALVCAVRGRPACEVAWSRNGRELDPGAYSVSREFDPALFVTRSTLRFVGPSRSILQPKDNGAYGCSAQNSHGKITRTFNLVVKFPPLIQTSTTKLALDPAASEISLECEILAQPKPKVTWEVGSNSYVSNVSQDTLTPYKHRATLFGVRSHGRFTCVARNALGEARHSVDVVPRGPPDPPTNLRMLSPPNWDRVSLSWQPGFDGGLQASMWLRCTPPPEGRSADEPIRIEHDSSLRTVAANLTNLLPATNYSVVVFARNQLGSGSNSAELRFTTSELAMPTVTGLRRDGNSATTLLLDAWPAGYCLRVEAAASVKKSQTQQQQQQQKLDASERQWRQVKLQQSACDAPSDGRLTGLDLSTLTYRLSLCLADRLAVCGPAATTENMSGFPEVSSLTIIIVAAFCTLLIICLVAILVFFCCRNRPLASKEAASSGDAATSAARASELDSPPARRDSRLRRHPEPDLMASTYKSFSSGKPYAMVSPHPSLTSTDETSIDQTNKVFSTLLSANHPIVGNNNLESGSDNSGTFLHPGRQRKVIYEVVV